MSNVTTLQWLDAVLEVCCNVILESRTLDPVTGQVVMSATAAKEEAAAHDLSDNKTIAIASTTSGGTGFGRTAVDTCAFVEVIDTVSPQASMQQQQLPIPEGAYTHHNSSIKTATKSFKSKHPVVSKKRPRQSYEDFEQLLADPGFTSLDPRRHPVESMWRKFIVGDRDPFTQIVRDIARLHPPKTMFQV